MLGDEVEIERSVGDAGDSIAEKVEAFEALREIDEFGVGDGVGSAREKVGEADLMADGARENAQR